MQCPGTEEPEAPVTPDTLPPCPCCGGHMSIVGIFLRWPQPRGPPPRSPPNRECSS